MRDELLFAREDVLCLGMGSSLSEAVYAELHYLVGVQNGSHHVHLQKARFHWTDSSVVGFVVRIRYCMCHLEGNEGECLGGLPSSTSHQ